MQYKSSFNGFVCSIEGLPSHIVLELYNLLSTRNMDDELYELFKNKTSLPISINKYTGCKHLINNFEENIVSFLSGLLPKVIEHLKKFGISLKFDSNFNSFDYNADSELSSFLYPHQNEIVKTCLKKRRGTVGSPTASGKTISLSELTRVFKEAGGNILITVPTIALLYQMKSDIEKFYNLRNESSPDIGLIGDGNLDLNKKLTVAIPDTLVSKILQEDEFIIHFLSNMNVWVADEFHTNATVTSLLLAEKLSGRRISCGLSATPWSLNGTDLILEGLFGPKIIEIKESDMIDKGIIMKPLFKFYNAPSSYVPRNLLNKEYSHWLYNALYQCSIVKNMGRNKLIVDNCVSYLKSNNYPLLVLVNNVGTSKKNSTTASHADILHEMFKLEGYELPIVHGQKSSKYINQTFDDLKNFKLKGIICSSKIITEGVSINNLGAICLAAAGKSDKDLIQRCGRVLRLSEGKQQPVIFDYIDQGQYFKNQSISRMDIVENIYGKDCLTICN